MSLKMEKVEKPKRLKLQKESRSCVESHSSINEQRNEHDRTSRLSIVVTSMLKTVRLGSQ